MSEKASCVRLSVNIEKGVYRVFTKVRKINCRCSTEILSLFECTRPGRGYNGTDVGTWDRSRCGGGGILKGIWEMYVGALLRANAESRVSHDFRGLRLKFRILSGEIQR